MANIDDFGRETNHNNAIQSSMSQFHAQNVSTSRELIFSPDGRLLMLHVQVSITISLATTMSRLIDVDFPLRRRVWPFWPWEMLN